MKPITTNLPKFLVVNSNQPKQNWNKHILKPWVEGEIVKVSENQKPSSFVNSTESKFRSGFVRVLRKGDDGLWNLEYVSGWENFNQLIKKQ